MKGAKRLLAITAAVVATASAAGVTIHRSFRGGYPAAVSEARQNRRGLWAAEAPINPYQWRKSRRNM